MTSPTLRRFPGRPVDYLPQDPTFASRSGHRAEELSPECLSFVEPLFASQDQSHPSHLGLTQAAGVSAQAFIDLLVPSLHGLRVWTFVLFIGFSMFRADTEADVLLHPISPWVPDIIPHRVDSRRGLTEASQVHDKALRVGLGRITLSWATQLTKRAIGSLPYLSLVVSRFRETILGKVQRFMKGAIVY